MKLRKTEICAIFIAAVFVALVFGYHQGKTADAAAFSISTSQSAAVAPTPVTAAAAFSEEKQEAEDISLLNINTATEEPLQTLDGIGETLAARIVAYREENGEFLSIREIVNVRGIGSGIFEKISERITVQ